MPEQLSIVVVDENRIRAAVIEAGLREAGHSRVTVLDVMHGIAGRIAEVDPDVIVIDLESPSRDALESMFALSRAVRRPVAMFVDCADRSSIEAAIDAGVSAYVVDGLRQERVKPILDLAITRFNAYSRMARELDAARSALADRTTIDRAKGILMSTRGLSEQQAYALLRKTAMDRGERIADVAASLVSAADLLVDGAGR